MGVAGKILEVLEDNRAHHDFVAEIDISWVGSAVVEEGCHLQDLEQIEGHEGALEQIANAPVFGVGHETIYSPETKKVSSFDVMIMLT